MKVSRRTQMSVLSPEFTMSPSWLSFERASSPVLLKFASTASEHSLYFAYNASVYPSSSETARVHAPRGQRRSPS